MVRTIKRYDNRKLYDTEASNYVSQKDIAELVRDGETVRIVDNSTGEDLTAQTLTQIILEEGKEDGHGLLPTETLHGLLRRGGQALDQSARQVSQRLAQVKKGVDGLVQQSFSQLGRLARGASGEDARADEVEALHEQLARLEARLAEVLDRVEDDATDGGPRTEDGAPSPRTDGER